MLEDFIVHPDEGRNQRTDADLIGVRFGNRCENGMRPMQDDPLVADCAAFCNVIIAEVKTGQCALNGPWTNLEKGNIQRVLKAIGCFPDSAIGLASESLYKKGTYLEGDVQCRLIAFGQSKSSLPIPDNAQITWQDVIKFIYKRLTDYRTEKSSTGTWACDGKELKRICSSNEAEFEQRCRELFSLNL